MVSVLMAAVVAWDSLVDDVTDLSGELGHLVVRTQESDEMFLNKPECMIGGNSQRWVH